MCEYETDIRQQIKQYISHSFNGLFVDELTY